MVSNVKVGRGKEKREMIDALDVVPVGEVPFRHERKPNGLPL